MTRRVFLSPPHVSDCERQLLLDAFDSNWIAPLGPHVDTFEREFAEKLAIRHALALNSGTAALHLSLVVLGVGGGDEVMTSTLTFAATANAIRYVGATPVFIDCDSASWNMDPALLAGAMEESARRGKLPRAVVVVDLYGQCADYRAIGAICTGYQVPLVEDAAEALGASCHGRPAGTWGDLGCFSFNGNKIITTSGGGMLVSNNGSWIDRARMLASQAREPAVHYQHSHVGYNYRLSNLLAAVGRGQLQVLQTRVEQRRANNLFYRNALRDVPGIQFMPEADYGQSNGWLTCITIDPDAFGASSEDVRLALEGCDIESRPVWKPLHLQPVFSEFPRYGGVEAEHLFDRGLCLPSGSSLAERDRNRVVDVIRSVAERRRVRSAA